MTTPQDDCGRPTDWPDPPPLPSKRQTPDVFVFEPPPQTKERPWQFAVNVALATWAVPVLLTLRVWMRLNSWLAGAVLRFVCSVLLRAPGALRNIDPVRFACTTCGAPEGHKCLGDATHPLRQLTAAVASRRC